MNRIKVALKLRAERKLSEGKVVEAKEALVEWFDLEKDSGFVSSELMALVEKVEIKEVV